MIYGITSLVTALEMWGLYMQGTSAVPWSDLWRLANLNRETIPSLLRNDRHEIIWYSICPWYPSSPIES